MAKVQKDDDYAKSRFRSFVIQRSYDYDVTVYDEETGEKHIPDDAPTPDEWMDKIIAQFKKREQKQIIIISYFMMLITYPMGL